MAHYEIRFPTDIAQGMKFGPAFDNSEVPLASGHVVVNQGNALTRDKGVVGLGIRSESDMAAARQFFIDMRANAHTFRFFDPGDYQATGQAASPSTGDGANKSFQLQKSYGSVNPYTRTCRKIIEGETIDGFGTFSTAVYLDGVAQASGWSLDADTGIVTFAAAPGGGVAVTADFYFDKIARFEITEQQIEIELLDIQSWMAVAIREALPAS